MTPDERRAKDREYRKARRERLATGLCTVCCVRGSSRFSMCRRCYDVQKRYQMTKTEGSAQDLASYPNISFGTGPSGLRYFSCWLPWPATTKHTRTAMTVKPGFRPLVKAAKAYQNFLIQAVLVNNVPREWIRPGTEAEMDVICFGHKSDADQYTGGLQDDLTKTGIWGDDKNIACTHSRRLFVPKTEEKRIYLAVWETQVPQKGQ